TRGLASDFEGIKFLSEQHYGTAGDFFVTRRRATARPMSCQPASAAIDAAHAETSAKRITHPPPRS
ncbi:hypothetical protein, partial [Xanthomonas bromi]|uniref:hypothetical protein n=1 Tax=Xanthomonas bromi TaxID=56449 RepID=UPI001CA4FCA7